MGACFRAHSPRPPPGSGPPASPAPPASGGSKGLEDPGLVVTHSLPMGREAVNMAKEDMSKWTLDAEEATRMVRGRWVKSTHLLLPAACCLLPAACCLPLLVLMLVDVSAATAAAAASSTATSPL